MRHYYTEKALLEPTQAIATSDHHQDEIEALNQAADILIDALVLMCRRDGKLIRGFLTLADIGD